MTAKGPQIVTINPDPREVAKHVRAFAKRPGWVTCLDDSLLPTIKALIPDEEEVQVCAFGDVARRVLLALGVIPPPLLARSSELVLLQAACEGLPDEHPFYGSRSYSGFHAALSETLAELRHAGWTPEKLASSGVRNAEALASVWDELLALEGRVGRCSASAHIQQVLEHDPGKAAPIRLMVIGCDEWLPDAADLLNWIARGDHEVVVVVEHGLEAFVGSQDVIQRLESAQLGKTPKPNWAASIFSDTPVEAGAPQLDVIHAPDTYAECEWALRACVQAQGAGTLEHRIVILGPDLSTYVPLLRTVGLRFGITLSARLPVPVLSNGFARFVLEALRALPHEDCRGLLALSRSSYLCSSEPQREKFCDVVRDALKVPKLSWDKVLEWSIENQEAVPVICSLLRWRETACQEPHGVAVWQRMLLDWLRGEPVAAMVLANQSRRFIHDQHALTAMMRPLIAMAGVEPAIGTRELALGDFVRLAERSWEDESMVLPPHIDSSTPENWDPNKAYGIRVVSRPTEIGEADMVVAMGMAEGVLPRRRTEDPVLSDEDRQRLNRCETATGKLVDSFFKARKQRDEFVRICGAASKRLLFTYPRSGSEDSANLLSAYVRRIQSSFPELVSEFVPSVTELAPPAEQCRLPADLRLTQALEGPRPEAEYVRITDPEIRKKLRPVFEEGVPIRQIAATAECSFRAFARHRLNLRPNRARLSPAVIGSIPDRARLLESRTREAARESLLEEARRLVLEHADHLTESELTLLEAGIQKQIEPWVEREFATRELFGIQVEESRAGVQAWEPPFLCEHTINARTVKLTAGPMNLIKIGDSWVISRYGASGADFPNRNKHLSQYLEYALSLILLCRTPNPGMMIDSSKDGERRLHLFSRDGLRQKNASKSKIRSSDIEPEDMRVFMKETSGVVKRLIEELDTAEMLARPGTYCERCTYGEWCRVSTEFGDGIDDTNGGEED